MRTTVAVVGGGLSGLYTTRLLHASGIDFQLYEARERFGGRIYSLDKDGKQTNDGFDLGPSWFWPDLQPKLADLIKELKLPVFPQDSAGDVVFQRMSKEKPQRYRGMTQVPESMRIEGGTSSLVEALVKDLPEGSLNLGKRVSKIRMNSEDITLTISSCDNNESEINASYVIFALPPRLLEHSVSFDPEIETSLSKLWQNTPTWMAPHAKFFAIYDKAFWKENGLSGTAQSMVGPLVEIHDATTSSGSAALFGFLGIGAAQRKSIGKEEIIQSCLNQLAKLFGSEAAFPKSTLFKDWAEDSFTSTPLDSLSTGHPEPQGSEWVAGIWKNKVFLAGSETSMTDPGYLAGAVDAAEVTVTKLKEIIKIVQ